MGDFCKKSREKLWLKYCNFLNMEKLTLTSEEKKKLDIRGFYILQIITFKDFIKNTFFWLVLSGIFLSIILYMLLLNTAELLFFHIILTILGTLFISSLFLYIFSSTIFFWKKNMIAYGVINKKGFIEFLIRMSYIFRTIYNGIDNFWEEIGKMQSYKKDNPVLFISILWCMITLMGWSYYLNRYFPIITEADIVRNISYILIPIWTYLWVGWIWNTLINHFHPLYAFWNIWEKIQKLTPAIESKSKEIQKNFEKDMNFRVLSEWFDTLSSTFSEIVSLVIKLERVEKKANKWNLFDSEKYINSLRGDIITPLKSLKSFLEEQRMNLRESQKELQKVRVKVGGDNELTSESELSSKRSEGLLVELDENISKLEEMIGKIY